MIRKTVPIFFLAAVTVLVFWKVIFHNEFTLLVGADMSSSYFPWFDVASYWLKKGVLLLWDPYVYAGKFNMGELQPGLYYPLNWLFMTPTGCLPRIVTVDVSYFRGWILNNILNRMNRGRHVRAPQEHGRLFHQNDLRVLRTEIIRTKLGYAHYVGYQLLADLNPS